MQTKKHRSMSMILAIALTLGTYFSAGATSKIYYVSTSGNDSNTGTSSAPFRTISKGVSVLAPGDELQIYGGTYAEEVTVSKSGTSSAYITIKPVSSQRVIVDGGSSRTRSVTLAGNYIILDGLELTRAASFCLDVTGSNITVRNMNIYNCTSHAARIKGSNVIFENSLVHDNVQENYGGTNTTGGWGVALRAGLGSQNVTIRNNKVYNNWGEGIAAVQSSGASILNNTVYDNFSINIYVDNSHDVNVENNFVYSTNPTYYRSGSPANCISMAEESYTGWGAQLARIRIVNNIAAFCKRGIGYTYSEVTNGGLDTVTIADNTIWGVTDTGILVINQTYKTKNSVIANNIVEQPDGRLADIQPTSGISMHHNFWVSPVSLLNRASGSGDKTGDVKLATTPTTNPTSFRLSSSSPAIGAAADLGIIKDFEGKNRTLAYDMGAIEYAGTASATATATQAVVATATSVPTKTATAMPATPTATQIIAPTATQIVAQGSTTTYDDKNAAFNYSGDWNDIADSGAYGGSFKKSMAPGQSVSMTFTGTSFSLLYTTNSTFAKMDIFVDGALVGTIDQYSASRQMQQKWNSPPFTSGTHTLKLVHKGTDTTTRVTLDAVTVSSSGVSATATSTIAPTQPPATATATAQPPSTAAIYDDKNAVFVYSGDWSDMADSGAYNGSFKKSMAPGQSVSMTFSGRSFSILYTKNSAFTKMDVFVDGVLVGTIDQYAASREVQQRWDLPIALASGTHTLKLVHKGTDTTTRVTLDAIPVYP